MIVIAYHCVSIVENEYFFRSRGYFSTRNGVSAIAYNVVIRKQIQRTVYGIGVNHRERGLHGENFFSVRAVITDRRVRSACTRYQEYSVAEGLTEPYSAVDILAFYFAEFFVVNIKLVGTERIQSAAFEESRFYRDPAFGNGRKYLLVLAYVLYQKLTRIRSSRL